MTTSPLTTVREAIRRVIQRFAASITQRPLSAGDLQPEASLAPIPETIPLPPQPRCTYPTEWGYDWMTSHRWVAAFGSLTCQACGMIWPKPKGEAEL